MKKELSPSIRAIQLCGQLAKRRCEWAAPMFNPCGAVRILSGGKVAGAPGCLVCEAKAIHEKAMNNFAKGFEAFTGKPIDALKKQPKQAKAMLADLEGE